MKVSKMLNILSNILCEYGDLDIKSDNPKFPVITDVIVTKKIIATDVDGFSKTEPIDCFISTMP